MKDEPLPDPHALDEALDRSHFVERPLAGSVNGEDQNRCWWVRLEDGGQLTVLDRMTGYGDGIRDTETGYRNKRGAFWLASGSFDIRRFNGTYSEAVKHLKKHAHIKNYKRKCTNFVLQP